MNERYSDILFTIVMTTLAVCFVSITAVGSLWIVVKILEKI